MDSAVAVDGQVEGRRTRLLVDTGSAVTILREDVWQEAVSGLQRRLETATQPVVAANGEELQLVGQSPVSLQVGGLRVSHTVLVARGVTQECLLGADFLSRHGCVVDLRDNVLLAGGQSVPVHFNSSAHCLPPVCFVTLAEKSVIPGRHQMRLPVHLSPQTPTQEACLDNYTGILEPVPEFVHRRGLLVARSLSTCSDSTTVACFLNPSPAAVTVHAHEKVGFFQPTTAIESVGVSAVHVKPSAAELDEAVSRMEQGVTGLTQMEASKLHCLLQEYTHIISTSDRDIGRTSVVRHSIDTGDASPVRQPARRLPFHQREKVRQLIDDMLSRGVIEPAAGPWSSPIVLVPKKDGTTRFCVDFRRLNNLTRKDAHPLPRIDDTLDTLSGARWFSTLDLASGYWQVELNPADREKTAFITPFGLHQFRVMPFGLCNAPSTFQRLMEHVLAGLHWTSCLVYLDDIIIFSKTLEDHLQQLREVFEHLEKAGLKIKPTKCCLLRKSVRYLGHIISEKGVQTDPDKTRCVAEWSQPTDLKELRQFLGFASYYRRFVRNFAHIAAPLYHLTEKGKNWCWSDDCEEAFSTLKHRLTSTPVLSFPRFDQEFTLDVDASAIGLGAVLSQEVQGVEQVVAYASRTLSKAERQYCATRREMLALVWGTRQFRPYLYGRRFRVRTDHNALRWLQSFREPEGQVARWLELLSEFDFRVAHRAGVKHANADGLSRTPCRQCGQTSRPLGEGDNSYILTSEPVESNTLSAESWMPHWSVDELHHLQSADPDLQPVIHWLEAGLVPEQCPTHGSRHLQSLWAQRQQLTLRSGLLYRQWEDIPNKGLHKRLQLVLPRELIHAVLTEVHNSATGGHLGVTKTLEKARRFYWPGQRRDVEDWCRSCTTCGARKSPSKRPRAPMQLERAGQPMQRVAMDILGPLPETPRGNKYVLVISDYFTKWCEALPMANMEAATVARLFVSEFVCRFGAPESLHTDQGRNFESTLVKEMCRLLGIHKTRTTPYHPQSDGMVERLNRTILAMLSISTAEHERDWDLHLPAVMLAYRSSVQETTGATPFSLMFGREVCLPVDIMFGTPPTYPPPTSPSEYAHKLRERLHQAYHFVREHAGAQQRRQKYLCDRRAGGLPFNIGDRVWLHCPAVPRGRSCKFHQPWQGPFVVLKTLSDVTYRIQREGTPRRRVVVHYDRLKPYQGRDDNLSTESHERPDTVVPNRPATPPLAAEPRSTEEEEHTASETSDEDELISSDELSSPEQVPPLRRSQRIRRPPDRYSPEPFRT